MAIFLTGVTLGVALVILLFCPPVSEVDAGGMAVEVEPSHQYSITYCCHVTDGSRGAAWQNGIWHGSVYEAEGCYWIPLCRKKWHPLTFIACRTFMETKQWKWAQWGGGDSDSGSSLLVQLFMSVACRLLFISGRNAVLMVVTVLQNSVLWLRVCSIK